MNTVETTQVEAVRSMTNKELVVAVLALQAQVAELVAQRASTNVSSKSDVKEMTDDDARSIMTGSLSAMKHKDAASQLGLTYGQVYSCRKEFTFKHIHKEIKDGVIVA